MNDFYPRLFKLNEVSASKIKDWVATKPTSVIRIDTESDDDKVLMVDRKSKDDVITKEYIDSITKKKVKDDMMEFLKKTNPKITIDNVDQWNITFEKFWDFQVEMFKFKEENDPSKKSKGKATSGDTSNEAKESIKLLHEFYSANNKGDEFNDFAKNLPSGAIQNSIEKLFIFMARIIGGKEDSINHKLFDDVLNLSKADQDQWKEDMITFLYSMKDIEEMSQGNFYKSQVLNKQTFIRSLFNVNAPGVGRGELMMCYLYKGAKAAGGDVDYDIVFYQGHTYEVKEYLSKKDGKATDDSAAGESIRLGKGGKVGQYSQFEDVYLSVVMAGRLYRKYEKELKASLNPVFMQLWHYMQNNRSDKGYDKAIADAVGTGEVSNANLNRIILWNYFANDLITKKDQGVPEEVTHELSRLYYVKFPEKLKRDFDRTPQTYFKKNAGLDAFIIFRPTKINICRQDDLKYATISQAGFKFIEKTEDRQPTVADAAFSKWKSDIQKAIKQSTEAEDKKALTDVLNNISFGDFYEKEGMEEHLAKVDKIEQEEKSSALKKWQDRHDAMQKRVMKKKTKEGQDRERSQWLKDNPKPGESSSKNESFYPRLFR
jgi:hypothetical protein